MSPLVASQAMFSVDLFSSVSKGTSNQHTGHHLLHNCVANFLQQLVGFGVLDLWVIINMCSFRTAQATHQI